MTRGFQAGQVLDFETLSIICPQEPPSEIRLFREGENESTKGSFLFDKKAADMVMAKYHAMGRKVTFDYDHKALDPKPIDPALSGKSAALCNLEIRGGELWAVNIKWTPSAALAISNGEWPFISPAFTRDGDRRPNWLLSVAITGNPALYDLPTLIAASIAGSQVQFFSAPAGLVVLGAVAFRATPVHDAGGWDADAAVARLRKWASSDGSGKPDTIDLKKYARGFAYVKGDGSNLGDYSLPHHDVVNGELVVVPAGVSAAAGAVSGARGGTSIPAADLPAVRRHLAQEYHLFHKTAPWEAETTHSLNARNGMYYSDLPQKMKDQQFTKAKMCKAFGCTAAELDDLMKSDKTMTSAHKKALDDMADGSDGDGDSDEQATALIALALGLEVGTSTHALTARAGALRNAELELCNITGRQTLASALGVIEAWRVAAQGASAVAEKLAALEVKQTELEIASIIEKAQVEGKIAPVSVAGLLARAKQQPNAIVWLTSMIEVLPVQSALLNVQRTPVSGAGAKQAAPTLEQQRDAAGNVIVAANTQGSGVDGAPVAEINDEMRKVMKVMRLNVSDKEFLEQHNAIIAEENRERAAFNR